MKINRIILIVIILFAVSCSEEEDRKTSTVIFEASGTGNVKYIINSEDCIPEQLGCAFESVTENPSLPFEVKVEDYYTDLISIKIIVENESEKENIRELKITIDGESQILKKEDFLWWDDAPYGMQLVHSVRKLSSE